MHGPLSPEAEKEGGGGAPKKRVKWLPLQRRAQTTDSVLYPLDLIHWGRRPPNADAVSVVRHPPRRHALAVQDPTDGTARRARGERGGLGALAVGHTPGHGERCSGGGVMGICPALAWLLRVALLWPPPSTTAADNSHGSEDAGAPASL